MYENMDPNPESHDGEIIALVMVAVVVLFGYVYNLLLPSLHLH